MNRSIFIGASLALLVACGNSNPFTNGGGGTGGGGTGGGTGASGIPAALAGDLKSITYSPGASTITIEGIALDNTPITAVYNRTPALDRPGYQAYAFQDDPLDRHTTAFVAQSGNSGSVRGGVVVTGGNFNRVFSGNYYERDGSYTPPSATTPTSGQVSYAGNYVGLLNGGGDGSALLPVPPGTDPAITPTQAGTVTGLIFLNADFADNQVEGAVYNRVWQEGNGGAGQSLRSVALVSTGIGQDGTFHGTQVEYDGIIDEDIGDWGGIFGGPNAEGVAGAVVLDEWDGPSDELGIDGELEWGVFVLDQCGTPDANAPVCAAVN